MNNAAAISVYPNPSKYAINITGLDINDNVILYDMMGRQQNQKWVAATTGTNSFQYSNLPAGGYILVIADANGDTKARIPIMKQ